MRTNGIIRGTSAVRPALHRAAVAALLLVAVCGGCSHSNKAETASTPAITIATVMNDYKTAATEHLQRLQRDFNSDLPSNASFNIPPLAPILYLDYDQISTWFALSEGPDSLEEAIGDFIRVSTGRPSTETTVTLLAQAMNSLDAEGVIMQKSGQGNCLVVPEYPGISFDSFYRATLAGSTVFPSGNSQAGAPAQSDPMEKTTITVGMTTRQFQDFVNAHESWHCLDIRYIRDTGDGLEGAVKQNRTEMFADIGAAMEAIRNGADLTLIDKAEKMRAAWALYTGPRRVKNSEEGADYASIGYATSAGLEALKARIQKTGLDDFRKLDRTRMRGIAYELTDANCITDVQARALQHYFSTYHEADVARGALPAAPPAAAALINRMKTLTAASLRPSTPDEIAARQRAAQEAADYGGLTEDLVLGQLKARAAALGGATVLANQLKARQELTDALRQKLYDDPASEVVTEAQLKLVLYTDPRLAPPPPPQNGAPDGASQGGSSQSGSDDGGNRTGGK